MSSFPFTITDYAHYARNKKDFNISKSYAIIDSVKIPASRLIDTGTSLTYGGQSIFPTNTFYGVVDGLEEKSKEHRENQLKKNIYSPENPYPPSDIE